MAIWQFHIIVIPRFTLITKFKHLPTHIEMGSESETSWWSLLDINLNELNSLLDRFGKLQEWTRKSDNCKSYGNSDTNDATVCYNEESLNVEEVSVRIDLRSYNYTFIENLLTLADKYDCLLMDIGGRIFEPTLDDLKKHIGLSNAERYISDPLKFINGIEDGSIKIE